MLYYIVAYGIMNIGAFTVIAYLAGKDGQEPQLAAVAVAAWADSVPARPWPWPCASSACWACRRRPASSARSISSARPFRLAQGSPHQFWTNVLVILALLNTAVSSGYYLRIIGAAYYRTPEGPAWPRAVAPVGAALVLCSVLVLLIGLRPGRLAGPAGEASRAAVLAGQRACPRTGRPPNLRGWPCRRCGFTLA